MGFQTVKADRTPGHVEVSGVVYSVLTSPYYQADGYLDKLRSRRAIGMLLVEAGERIRFVGIHGLCSHWRMREGQVMI